MRVRVRHNLAPDELTKSLASLAVAEGVAHDLHEHIEKAWEDHRIPEAFMQALWEEAVSDFRALRQRCADNVRRWFAHRMPDLFKASRPRLMLTQDDLDELVAIIRAHFDPSAFSVEFGERPAWRIPQDVEAAWKRAGLIAPDVDLLRYAQDSWIAGRLYQVLRDGDSLARMRELAARYPLTRADRLAIRALREHAADNLTGLVSSIVSDARRMTASAKRRLVHDIIARYGSGDLRVTRYSPVGLAGLGEDEIAALETDRLVGTWRRLASELYHYFKDDPTEKTRDWARVAASETRMAYNWGQIQAMADDGVEFLYFDVQPDACARCKQAYLEPDGVTPRIFPVRDFLAQVIETGGMNVGRKASLMGDPERGWVPTALLHPWCRCKARPYRRGMPVVAREPGGAIRLVQPGQPSPVRPTRQEAAE